MGKITRSWAMPAELTKISGIDFIDKNRIACIQDEVGSVYIYNLRTQTIEQEIPFAPPGDYEGIAVVSNSIFIASSDGRILEIAGFRQRGSSVKEYGTHLTTDQNMEGLCFDRVNNRLLAVIKGVDDGSQNYKGIYSFDLKTRKMAVRPVIRIDLLDSTLNRFNSRKLQSNIQPSDIDINPINNRIYICDAERLQLVVLNREGKTLNLFAFDRNEITQPEGISFTPSGEMYIASSGVGNIPGKIVLINPVKN